MRCFYRLKDSPLNKLSNDLISYGKEHTCYEAMDLSVSFNQHASSICLKTALPFSRSRDVFIYLELAYHDEQNGGQNFKIGARIAELWQFKARKVKKTSRRNCLAIFKPGLRRPGFFRMRQRMVLSSPGTNGE